MRLKHTQARKARRASAFHKMGHYSEPSRKRVLKRAHLQRPQPHAFGFQKRLQVIKVLRPNRAQPEVKVIAHVAS